MSVTPEGAPIRPAYAKDSAGNYYRIGGGGGGTLDGLSDVLITTPVVGEVLTRVDAVESWVGIPANGATASQGANPHFAWDGNDTTFWYNTIYQAAWTRADFGTAITVDKCRIKTDGALATFVLEWSDNDSTWTQVGLPLVVDTMPDDVTISFAAQTHRYWRLYSSATSYVQLDVQLTAVSSAGWINAAPQGGGYLNDLSDVIISAADTGHALVYDYGTATWVNRYLVLDDLGDVDAVFPADGGALVWNEDWGAWKPSSPVAVLEEFRRSSESWFLMNTATPNDPGHGQMALDTLTLTSAVWLVLSAFTESMKDAADDRTLSRLGPGWLISVQGPPDTVGSFILRVTGAASNYSTYWLVPVTLHSEDNLLASPFSYTMLVTFIPPGISGAQVLDDLSDVSTTEAGPGSVLSYNGSSWNPTEIDTQYVNTAGDTMSGPLLLPASIAGAAPVRVPHGTAPSSPVNGDMWTTSAGLYARINGATVGPLGAGGGGGIDTAGAGLTKTGTTVDVVAGDTTLTVAADSVVVNQAVVEVVSRKGAASGYASLDSGTKIPIAQVPTGTTAATVALGNAAAGLITTHEAAADPHTGYVLATGTRPMTGDLTVNSANIKLDSAGTASIIIDRQATTNYGQFEFRTNGVQKWTVGTRAGEGEDFSIFAGAGNRTLLISPTTFLATVYGDPTAALGVATKQYVDTQRDTRVAKTGDAMTGSLAIDSASGVEAAYALRSATGKTRWALIKNNVAETGGNSGAYAALAAYDDNGGYLGSVFWANRTDGILHISFGMDLGAAGIGNMADPIAPMDAANKRYVDARTPKVVAQATAPADTSVIWIDTA